RRAPRASARAAIADHDAEPAALRPPTQWPAAAVPEWIFHPGGQLAHWSGQRHVSHKRWALCDDDRGASATARRDTRLFSVPGLHRGDPLSRREEDRPAARG